MCFLVLCVRGCHRLFICLGFQNLTITPRVASTTESQSKACLISKEHCFPSVILLLRNMAEHDLNALAVDLADDHSDLPPAPVELPDGMIYCTLYFAKQTHTFVGGGDQVHLWLHHQKHFRRIEHYLIVLKVLANGDLWGESYDPRQTTFMPGKHYLILGDREGVHTPTSELTPILEGSVSP